MGEERNWLEQLDYDVTKGLLETEHEIDEALASQEISLLPGMFRTGMELYCTDVVPAVLEQFPELPTDDCDALKDFKAEHGLTSALGGRYDSPKSLP